MEGHPCRFRKVTFASPAFTWAKAAKLPIGPDEVSGTQQRRLPRGHQRRRRHSRQRRQRLALRTGRQRHARRRRGGRRHGRQATGDDIYYVDDVNDVVWEWGGQGIDTVRASLSYHWYTLPTGIENLELIGPVSLRRRWQRTRQHHHRQRCVQRPGGQSRQRHASRRQWRQRHHRWWRGQRHSRRRGRRRFHVRWHRRRHRTMSTDGATMCGRT